MDKGTHEGATMYITDGCKTRGKTTTLKLLEAIPSEYCPVCDTRLTRIKCKLVCEECGYYMSCSDYY